MYYIKIKDIYKKSERIVAKETTLLSYKDDYSKIFDILNECNYMSTMSDGQMSIYESTEINGYIYNTNMTKKIYELSLIKINKELTDELNKLESIEFLRKSTNSRPELNNVDYIDYPRIKNKSTNLSDELINELKKKLEDKKYFVY